MSNIDPDGRSSVNVLDVFKNAPNGRSSYDSGGECTCGCPGKPPCEEGESLLDKGMRTVNQPGVGLRKGFGGQLASFNTPANHVCGDNCQEGHFTESDMLKAYGEVGMMVAGGAVLKLVLRGGKYVWTVVNVTSKFAKFAHASKYGFDSYRKLRNLTKGKGLHVHHLIEKRFANVWGEKADDMLSIVLTEAEHARFTKLWKAEIGYINSNSRINTANATKQQIIEAAKRVYSDYPEILQVLKIQ